MPLPAVDDAVSTSDEFNVPATGLQWQWQANLQATWGFPSAMGYYRLFSVLPADTLCNVWNYPNVMGQKFPAESFTATVKLDFKPRHEGEQFGLVVLGSDYAFAGVELRNGHLVITQHIRRNADKQGPEKEQVLGTLTSSTVYLRVQVRAGALCSFGYSSDGTQFTPMPETLAAKPGRWVGAKIGIFCVRQNITNDAGFADIDWFRIE
jgi:beta-xylosidase